MKLKAFEKFGSTTAALSTAAAIIDSKLEKGEDQMVLVLVGLVSS